MFNVEASTLDDVGDRSIEMASAGTGLHGAGRLQRRGDGQGAMGQNDVWREPGQFRRVSTKISGIGSGPAGVDPQVATDGPAKKR
jgi:hypothetical protein